MKIDLDILFKNKWDKAYLIKNRENRQMVCLYRREAGKAQRKTISYARYLMSAKLGRELCDFEEVDHIDNDKTNDSIDNLQVLTHKENVDKYFELVHSAYEHGTYRMYRTGKCRCALCKEADKEVKRRSYYKHREGILKRRRDARKKQIIPAAV